MRTLLAAAAAATLSLFATHASAATFTVDASSGQAGTFFVPAPGQEEEDPFYRGNGEDWGWMHEAIAPGFTSAILNISAYDVDRSSGELNDIQVQDDGVWSSIGLLAGANDVFSFTEFDLLAFNGGSLQNDIEAGLMVRMIIDTRNDGWLVSLSKSVITTDGAAAGNPNPTPVIPAPVPLPAGGLLLLSALGGAMVLRTRKRG